MGENNGISNRLLSAAIIIAIGLFMYLSQTQKNPVTGERQHVSMSPAQEIRLGLQSAPMMSMKMGGEMPSSDPSYIEVANMGNYLVNHTVAKISPWKFQFHLLADTKTVNAFALPGGQIFITMGLLEKLQTEAQLAGVLSHEMGHVIERHSAEQLAKSQLGQAMVMAVGVAARDPNHPHYAMNATMLASVINQMVELRFSRKDEAAADIWGLKLMEQAGFNPRAMIQVMEILKAADRQGHPIEMFQTHPNPDARIENIEKYLREHPPQGNLQEGKKLQH